MVDREVIAAEEPLVALLILLPPVPPMRVIKTVGAGVAEASKMNPAGAFRMIVPAKTSVEAA